MSSLDDPIPTGRPGEIYITKLRVEQTYINMLCEQSSVLCYADTVNTLLLFECKITPNVLQLFQPIHPQCAVDWSVMW